MFTVYDNNDTIILDYISADSIHNESFVDRFEELLYVEHELTPSNGNKWIDELIERGETLFDYHGCEFARVILDNTFGIHLYDVERC